MKKHLQGQHDQLTHGRDALASALSQTESFIQEKGLEDRDIYVDKEAELISQRKDPKELRETLGSPIKSEFLVDNPFISPHQADSLINNALEDRQGQNESLGSVLKREIAQSDVESVNLDEIIFSQRFVFEKPLLDHMRSKEYLESPLYLIEIDGKKYVHDNNHRFTAAILNDEGTLNVKVVKLDSSVTKLAKTNSLPKDFWANEAELLIAVFKPKLEAIYLTASFVAAEQIGIVLNYTVANALAVTWANTHMDTLLTQLMKTTVEGVGPIIGEWINSPDATMGDLQQSLEKIYNRDRASRIAITETTRAFAEAAMQQYTDNGITHWRWNTNNDEMIVDGERRGVCTICAPLHLKVVKIGEPFGENRKGEKIIKPPDAHIGDRCWVTPVVITKLAKHLPGGHDQETHGPDKKAPQKGLRARLRAIKRFKGPALETIDVWYDRQSDNWIVQRKDAEGYQIGTADYAGDREWALEVAEGHMSELWKTPEQKIPFSGEFPADLDSIEGWAPIGTVNEDWAMNEVTVYSIESNADKLLDLPEDATFMVAIAGPHKKKILAGNEYMLHSRLLHTLDEDDSVDNWVRFYRRDKGVSADTLYSGVDVLVYPDRQAGNLEAYDNIYLAGDYLSRAGLPRETPLYIKDQVSDTQVNTTFEKLVKGGAVN